MKMWRGVVLVFCALGVLPGLQALAADTLNLAVMPVSAAQREAINELAARYNSRGTHRVLVVAYPHEMFKARIETLLSDAGQDLDVVVWFGGERLRRLIRNGLIQPLDALSDQLNPDHFTKSALTTVRYGDQVWGVPVSYYPWGIFYRKSVFRKLGLVPPEDGAQLNQVIRALRQAGHTPFALGSEAPWTLLAWFDYLDLRLNGKAFHEQLTAGQIPFTDDRVRRVFRQWADWLAEGLYPRNHGAMDWRSALPYYYRKLAPMMLMGQFVLVEIPQAIREDSGFLPFPDLNPEVPRAEDAPTDILIMPARAPHREAALDFLRFMAEPEQQAYLNAQYGTFSPLRAVPPPEDRVRAQGHAILAQASELTQFFDRDAPAELAEGMLAMVQAFVREPEALETQLQALERVRRNLRQPTPSAD